MNIIYECEYCGLTFKDEGECDKHETEHAIKELFNNKIITFFNEKGEKLDIGFTAEEFDAAYHEAEYIYVKTLPLSLGTKIYDYFGYELPREGWYKNTNCEYMPFDMKNYIKTAKNFEKIIENTLDKRLRL